ncbi:MAG: polysaccharide deacetylase family protein [Rhodobacteraceae bacterium]|nr:polysaccharide deacetylase family protein [Paracoccaceae bacterium]
MIARAKQAATALLAAPPALALLRARAQRGGPVTVLCYHTLSADSGGPDAWTALRVADFRAQVAMLRQHHDIVPLDTALAEGPGRRGRPRAVITFDDGEAGLHRHLLPLLPEIDVPVTVYVATGQIETGRPYWFDRVMGALAQGACVIDLSREGLGRWNLPAAPGAARWAVLGGLLEALKRVEPARREALADRIAGIRPPPPGRPPLGPMTRAELAELAADPRVTIGAHSHCHNLLDQIPLAQAEASMERSRRLLREWTGQEVAHFAWPNGNHGAALRAAAARLGFRSAAALDNRLWRAGADLFALPRLAIGRYDSARRFRLRLAGL